MPWDQAHFHPTGSGWGPRALPVLVVLGPALVVPGKELPVPKQAALGQAVETPQVHILQAGQAGPSVPQMAHLGLMDLLGSWVEGL